MEDQRVVALAGKRPPRREIALLDKGFRPFFVLASLFAVAILPIRILAYAGHVSVMSLGHTGCPLEAPKSLTIAFALLIVAAIIRVVGPLVGGANLAAMHAAGTAWSLAFAIFALRIGPLLFRSRPDGRPGCAVGRRDRRATHERGARGTSWISIKLLLDAVTTRR